MPDSGDPRLSIVIPAYNEAARIEPALKEVLDYCRNAPFTSEILVVDDGSEDQTSEVVRRMDPAIRVIRYEPNRGKGYAVRKGMEESRGVYVLFMDADNSTPIREMEKFWPRLEAGADAVIGSRARRESVVRVHQSFLRETAGKCFNLFVRIVLGTPFPDTQCGFKCFRRAALVPILPLLTIDRFGFDPEILHLLNKRGCKMVDAPVEWTNEPNSRLSIFRDSLGMFWELLRIRWMDLKGRYRA